MFLITSLVCYFCASWNRNNSAHNSCILFCGIWYGGCDICKVWRFEIAIERIKLTDPIQIAIKGQLLEKRWKVSAGKQRVFCSKFALDNIYRDREKCIKYSLNIIY